jgi:hypothetical protein
MKGEKEMKKIILIALAVVLVGALGATAAVTGSEGHPASKATAQIAELEVISEAQTVSDEDPDWDADLDWTLATNILTQTIKTANDKDLFIDVSLLSGLYTETNVKSKGGNKDTSAAVAAVLLKVEVDDEEAFPGWIVYNGRVQVLSATLQGVLEDGVVVGYEEIGLIIGTLSANSFNFIVDDLDAGVHEVEVSALCVTFAASQAGSARAKAVIGLGSVTIEEVRMIRGEDAIIE